MTLSKVFNPTDGRKTRTNPREIGKDVRVSFGLWGKMGKVRRTFVF